jgi:hypothetical protein
MFLLMLISEKPAIVGKFVLPRYLRVTGWIATGVMLVASLGFLITALHPIVAALTFSHLSLFGYRNIRSGIHQLPDTPQKHREPR